MIQLPFSLGLGSVGRIWGGWLGLGSLSFAGYFGGRQFDRHHGLPACPSLAQGWGGKGNGGGRSSSSLSRHHGLSSKFFAVVVHFIKFVQPLSRR